MNGGDEDEDEENFSFRETFVGDKTRARAAARSTRERDLVSGLDEKETLSFEAPFRDTPSRATGPSRHWNAVG
jgi:hypothetical protein